MHNWLVPWFRHHPAIEDSPAVLEVRRDGWFEFSWPTVIFCAILLGGAAASQTSWENVVKSLDRLGTMMTARAAEPAKADFALVVTDDASRRLEVAATLSPRGFDPLLAQDAEQVRRQVNEHVGAVVFAVVDGATPNAHAIVRALAQTMPREHIVLLAAGERRENVGPILLDRLSAARSSLR